MYTHCPQYSHKATDEGPLRVSKEPQLKPKKEQWCSGCASQGHLVHECRKYLGEYPPATPSIVKYEDVLYCDRQEIVDSPIPSGTTSKGHNIPSYHSAFEDLPSTSTNIPLQTTSIPALMSLSIPKLSPELPTNCFLGLPSTSELTAKVLNPFFVLANRKANNQMDKTVRKNEERKYKHIIMSLSSNVVRQFLMKEIAQLDNMVLKIDPRFLLKQYIKHNRFKGTLSEGLAKDRYVWFRRLNMFLFGVHKLGEGYLHLDYLKKVIFDSKQELDEHKRKLLFGAYSYIFGSDCHIGVNYFNTIKNVIRRYNACDV